MLTWGADGDVRTSTEAPTLSDALEASGVSDSADTVAKAELTLEATALSGVDGGVGFNTDLFERGSIERLAARLAVAAASVADAVDGTALSAVSLLPADEAECVLRRFNVTAAAFPLELCVHELVIAQVARVPAAIALEWQGAQLSYAQLLSSAMALSAWVRSRGVSADMVVALQLRRSLEMVVGLLGVLLSGGAYLPLDPSWPGRPGEQGPCAVLALSAEHDAGRCVYVCVCVCFF